MTNEGAQREDAALAPLKVPSAWETHVKTLPGSGRCHKSDSKGAKGASGKFLPGREDKGKQAKQKILRRQGRVMMRRVLWTENELCNSEKVNIHHPVWECHVKTRLLAVSWSLSFIKQDVFFANVTTYF